MYKIKPAFRLGLPFGGDFVFLFPCFHLKAPFVVILLSRVVLLALQVIIWVISYDVPYFRSDPFAYDDHYCKYSEEYQRTHIITSHSFIIYLF